jgi:hypothetical protein
MPPGIVYHGSLANKRGYIFRMQKIPPYSIVLTPDNHKHILVLSIWNNSAYKITVRTLTIFWDFVSGHLKQPKTTAGIVYYISYKLATTE